MTSRKNSKKIAKAEKNAAYIMVHLDEEEVLTHFPVASFPASQEGPLKALISTVGPKCDWPGQRGKYVDFCSIPTNDNRSIAYIY